MPAHIDLETFWNSGLRNAWLYANGLSVYVRRGQHVIGEEFFPTLDIANVRVTSRKRRKGLWNAFRLEAEAFADAKEVILLVESILNEHLERSLRRHGYLQVPRSLPLSLYRPRM